MIMIYIPVWLDQKDFLMKYDTIRTIDLHSSMVRLERDKKTVYIGNYP